MLPITVRTEQPNDLPDISRVVSSAFAQSELGDHGEAELVDQIRKGKTDQLSLVAIHRDQLVGHILFSGAVLKTEHETIDGMGLAPMAVHPDFQEQGIGAALVREGLTRLDQAGCLFTVVLGHPEYYPRFGFHPAAANGIHHAFDGMPQDPLFVRFPNLAPEAFPRGTVYYCQEFGPQG